MNKRFAESPAGLEIIFHLEDGETIESIVEELQESIFYTISETKTFTKKGEANGLYRELKIITVSKIKRDELHKMLNLDYTYVRFKGDKYLVYCFVQRR